jgi:transcriptional regulator with XRE-family HTH domain
MKSTETITPEIGRKIRTLRESKLVTVGEIMRKTGVNASTISKIEDGKSENVRLSTLRGIATGLDMTPEEFRKAIGLSNGN